MEIFSEILITDPIPKAVRLAGTLVGGVRLLVYNKLYIMYGIHYMMYIKLNLKM